MAIESAVTQDAICAGLACTASAAAITTGSAPASPASVAMIADEMTDKRMGRSIGRRRTAITVGVGRNPSSLSRGRRQQLGPVLEVHRVVVIPLAAPYEAMCLED